MYVQTHCIIVYLKYVLLKYNVNNNLFPSLDESGKRTRSQSIPNLFSEFTHRPLFNYTIKVFSQLTIKNNTQNNLKPYKITKANKKSTLVNSIVM